MLSLPESQERGGGGKLSLNTVELGEEAVGTVELAVVLRGGLENLYLINACCSRAPPCKTVSFEMVLG